MSEDRDPGSDRPRPGAAEGQIARRFRVALATWRSSEYKLWNDYAVLAGAQLGIKVLGFLAFAWLARMLDPAAYGAIEYIVGLTAVFATVVDAGLGTVGVRHAAKDVSRLPALAFQIQFARLWLAIACVPAVVLVARSAATPVDGTLALLFAASLLTLPWRPEWLLQARERMTETAIARLLRTALFLAGVAVFVRSPADMALVGAAELAGACCMAGYCLRVQQTRITPVRLAGSLQGLPTLAREGVVVGAGNLIGQVNQYMPLFLLGTLVGGAETAWFAGATRIVGALLVFGNIYHYRLYPILTGSQARADPELGALLACSLRITAWAGSLAALSLSVLATPLLMLAFGPKLVAGADALRVMAWILPMTLCSGQVRWSLTAAGAQARVLGAQLAGLGTTIAIIALVGTRWGIQGYAVAALAGPIAVWVAGHTLAAAGGTASPPPAIAALPLALALACAALASWLDLGVAAASGLILGYGVLAFVVDRRLPGAIATLGGARFDGGGATRAEKTP